MSESVGANDGASPVDPTSHPPPFGALLKSSREELGLTQRELADRSGVSLPALRDIEQGRSRRPRPKSVRKLIASLELSGDDETEFVRAAGGSADSSMRAPTGPKPNGRSSVVTLGILGPLTIWHDGLPVPLESGKLKTILLRLALSPGEAVGKDELIDLLWGGGPPPTAVNLLHTYIRRIRRLLQPAPDTEQPLQTSSKGYHLVTAADRLDLARFRELAARGAETPDGDRALEAFAEAARLWRGHTDVDALRNHPLTAAVTEEYAALLSAYAATARDLGECEQVLPRLRSLAAEMDMHEPLHAELIATLSASGRQAEALAAYERIRNHLVEQLGLEPGAQLREAHRLALNGWPRPETKVARRSPSIQQTPSPPPDFVARDTELRQILEAFDGRGEGTGSAATVAVVGTAGVGKTALTLQAAWRLRETYPDGQLYADLHGVAETPTAPLEVLGRFLRALGVRDRRTGADESEDAALLRSELADRRILILLDNARDFKQVLPLLPGAGRCAVLITSRWRLPELDGARAIELGALPPADALALLETAIGERRMAAEPQPTRQLVADCGSLPLALRVAGARLASRPAWSVADLSKRLQDQGRRLSELSAGETSVPASFELSYRYLTEPVKRAFRLCSLLPGDDFGLDSVAALLGVDRMRADEILGELLDSSMLMQYKADRFRFHDLLGLYAARLFDEEDPARHRADLDRYHSWCLRAATAAMEWVYPQMVRWNACDDRETVFTTREAAVEWLEDEVPALVALIARLADSEDRHYAWQIADQLRGHFLLHRQFDFWLRSTEAGARAAGSDPSAEAAMHMSRGQAMWALGRHEEALEAYAAGARNADDCGWAQASAYLRHNIGLVMCEQGRLDEAERSFLLALELSEDELGHERAVTLNGLGTMCVERGRPREAVRHFAAALEINRRTGRERSYLANQSNLGMALRQLGEFDAAREHLEAALEGDRNAGDSHAEMNVLDELSMLYTQLGRGVEAVSLARQGRDLARILQDRRADVGISTTLGEALLETGDVPAAKDAFGRVLDTEGFPYFAARASVGLASALRSEGDEVGANLFAERAVADARRHRFSAIEADALTVRSRCLAGSDPASAAKLAQSAAALYQASGMEYLAERVRAEFGEIGAAEGPDAD